MSEYARIIEAYKTMAAEARYRPAAPGDGCGSVYLTPEQEGDPSLLESEAATYAKRFLAMENTLSFRIGVSNYETNRALVYTIEAARALCAGIADDLAEDLLEMALAELRRETKKLQAA